MIINMDGYLDLIRKLERSRAEASIIRLSKALQSSGLPPKAKGMLTKGNLIKRLNAPSSENVEETSG